MQKSKFENLFKPLKVGPVTLRNRIIASPIDSQKSREKATGGAGLIVLGGGFVNTDKKTMIAARNTSPFELTNRDIALKTKAELEFWRQGGSLVSIEIMHCGEYGSFMKSDFVYGPTAGTRKHDGAEIKALTPEMMEEIARDFGVSSATAKKVGFDMVTAHFAHGWLISEFLSSSWNKRTDEYGGSYENRIRFPRMVLQAMRKAVGKDFPIDMRINGKDWICGDLNDIDEVARFLEDMGNEGLLDMANISVGADMIMTGNIRMAPHAIHPHMVNADLTKYIKDRVKSIPITAVGAIQNPENAEKLVAEGYCDAVCIGRPMVADPKWAQKAYENRSDEIMPCLRCLYCFPMATRASNVGCSVNPRFNKEEAYPLGTKACNKKNVVIIGGGPAGMRAAITAYERGHKVTLLEKNDKLGGTIRFSDYVETKRDLNDYMKHQINAISKTDIDVKLGFEATYENVEALNPDVLMVAVGAKPFCPPIKGADKNHVIDCVSVFPKLREMGQDVVIIGGGTIGCELSIDLGEMGKNATVVEMTGMLNQAANNIYKVAINERIKELPTIKTMINTSTLEIGDDYVLVRDADGNEKQIKADNVIIATGLRSEKALAQSFFGITPETYILGDCNRVGLVKDAVQDGYMFALNILDN